MWRNVVGNYGRITPGNYGKYGTKISLCNYGNITLGNYVKYGKQDQIMQLWQYHIRQLCLGNYGSIKLGNYVKYGKQNIIFEDASPLIPFFDGWKSKMNVQQWSKWQLKVRQQILVKVSMWGQICMGGWVGGWVGRCLFLQLRKPSNFLPVLAASQ